MRGSSGGRVSALTPDIVLKWFRAEKTPCCERTIVSRDVEFNHEALPPLATLEREWRTLEAVARPSFFTSWQWVGTLLAALPAASRPSLLRGAARGETVGLALLGGGVTRRRHGLVRSRALYLNETGHPRFDSITIEHNGILAEVGRETAVFDSTIAWFADLGDVADELYISGSLLRPPVSAVDARGVVRIEASDDAGSIKFGG